MKHLPWPSDVTEDQIKKWEKDYCDSQGEKSMTKEEILKMLESLQCSAMKAYSYSESNNIYESGIKMIIAALKRSKNTRERMS